MQLFDKRAKVIIGSKTFSYPPFSIEFETEEDLDVLRSTTIRLYNPNDDTLSSCKGEKKGQITEYPLIEVEAGYKDNMGKVFKGEIIDYKLKKTKVDRILEIQVADKTALIWATKIINKTYQDMKASEIIKDMAGDRSGYISLGNDKFYKRFVARRFHYAVRRIAKETGSNYYCTNGYLNMKPAGFIENNAIILGFDSGLIDIPEYIKGGYRIKTLFLYELTPGRSIKLQTKNIKSIFRVKNVKKMFSSFKDSYCVAEVYR